MLVPWLDLKEDKNAAEIIWLENKTVEFIIHLFHLFT